MSDYERITEAIAFITSRVTTQPALDDIAAHLHMSPFHFHRLFSRWVGVTPKRFLQALTLERAKQLLREAKPLLEVSNAIGLSSGSRLYDHFVQLAAVTPGEYKSGGAGLAIDYAVHATPFGEAFVASTPRGICKFAFVEFTKINTLKAELAAMWPQASLSENATRTRAIIKNMFSGEQQSALPLSLHVSGTNFQVSVWQALLAIPPGSVASYTQVATHIGRPQSARAVGTAIGANPVALLIPCHRVIQQSGRLGGYHWGENRKHAILAWESARYD